MELRHIVDLSRYPLSDSDFAADCRTRLDRDGILELPSFITPGALNAMQTEFSVAEPSAYFCTQKHSVYLTPENFEFPKQHPANQLVTSSKGCICDDIVASNSPLRKLYDDETFRRFIRETTGQSGLFPYADPLSSINVHYARKGQELGWHFDNSEFAITLLLQKPEAGSRFEYIKDFRDSQAGEMNYEGVGELLKERINPRVLEMDAGTLVLFRGRNSIHRVSPNEGDRTRILAVLAYNSEPGIELSESARMTFYGRLN